MSKATLATKVLTVLAVALLLVAGVAATGFLATSSLSNLVRDYSADTVPALTSLNGLATAVGRATGAASALENGTLEAAVHRQASELIEVQVRTAAEARRALDSVRRRSVAEGRDEVSGAVETWRKDIDLLTQHVRARAAASERFAEAAAIQQSVTAQFEQLRRDSQRLLELLDQVSERTRKDAEELNAVAGSSVRYARWTLAGAFALAAMVTVLAGLLLTRSLRSTLGTLKTEAASVLDAVRCGKLEVRARVSAVHVEFQPIVQGLNDTVEAFVAPFRVVAEALDRIARGDLARIDATYQGDFDALRKNLNSCVDTLARMLGDVSTLAEAAVQGKLSTRADGSVHQGDFRRIVEGVNDTLDSVIEPINEAVAVLEQLAGRDLRARVTGEYRGDHARMKEALNSTAAALDAALSQVSAAVEQVSGAASQIASSSQNVASATSEQASSLEETSSSLETMSSVTRQSSSLAQEANGLADAAHAAAADGTGAMEQMKAGMQKIRASAEGTSQIIKDINEIAFQTNLLALNAAVEAARAGDAGRGFAVVAEEVRSLALRSKEAANKTEELIRESVRQTGEGETMSKHVSQKLSEIATAVAKVNTIIAEIATSSREQAAGIEQLNKAVGEMDRVTQQNAASSEESSATAAELASEADKLTRLVGSFRIGKVGSRPSMQARPVAGASPAPAAAASHPAFDLAIAVDHRADAAQPPVV